MRKWNWNSFQDILFVSFPFGTSQQDTILVLSSESKVYCRTRGRSGRAKGAKTKSGVKRRWQPRLGLLWGVLPAHGCLVCLHTFFSPTWSDKNCARIWFCSVHDKSNSAIDGYQYLLVGFEISWSVLVMDTKKLNQYLFVSTSPEAKPRCLRALPCAQPLLLSAPEHCNHFNKAYCMVRKNCDFEKVNRKYLLESTQKYLLESTHISLGPRKCIDWSN